jgi:hypothetical protein
VKTFFRDNGLTIALVALFLFSVLGMIWSGQAAYNKELTDHGSPALGLLAYMGSGNFYRPCSRTGKANFCRCRPMSC